MGCCGRLGYQKTRLTSPGIVKAKWGGGEYFDDMISEKNMYAIG
jgi:hypothetical protein